MSNMVQGHTVLGYQHLQLGNNMTGARMVTPHQHSQHPDEHMTARTVNKLSALIESMLSDDQTKTPVQGAYK